MHTHDRSVSLDYYLLLTPCCKANCGVCSVDTRVLLALTRHGCILLHFYLLLCL